MSYMRVQSATKSLVRPSYLCDGVFHEKHGFYDATVLLACCSREFLWYPFYIVPE